jgi:hypothetical protein
MQTVLANRAFRAGAVIVGLAAVWVVGGAPVWGWL